MFNLVTIIELVSVAVIAISICGSYYFIGRMIATRGRWKDEYPKHMHKSIYPNNPEKTTPPLPRYKLRWKKSE